MVDEETGVARYCGEITPTTWRYVPIDDDSFKMVPTRRLLTPNIDYYNLFDVSVDGRRGEELIDYTVTPNLETQEVRYDLRYKDYLKGERLRVDARDNNAVNLEAEPLYDQNRNLVF